MTNFTMMRVNQRPNNAPLFDDAPKSMLLLGTAQVSDLVNLNIDIDQWSEANPEGYQRDFKKDRAQRFAEYMELGENISPDILTLAIRDTEKDLKEPKSLGPGNIYSVDIDTKTPIQLVDGQHRWFGLKRLVGEGNPKPELGKFEFPFILMYNVPKYSEVIEFMTRHKTQQGVPTDLGDQLLRAVSHDKQRWKKLSTQLEANKPIWKDAVWTTLALDTIDLLRNDSTSVWHKNIRMPLDLRTPYLVCSQRTFSQSMKPFLVPSKRRTAPFENQSANRIVKYMNASWNAIREVLPNPFVQYSQLRYVVYHLVGVYSLNLLYHKLLTDGTIGIGPALLDLGNKGHFDKLQAELTKLYDVPAITAASKWDKQHVWTDRSGLFGAPGDKIEGGEYTLMGSNHATFTRLSGIMLSNIISKKKKEITTLIKSAPSALTQATITKKVSKK